LTNHKRGIEHDIGRAKEVEAHAKD